MFFGERWFFLWMVFTAGVRMAEGVVTVIFKFPCPVLTGPFAGLADR
jgi:hypothetical protein